jgi:hypothetical protein
VTLPRRRESRLTVLLPLGFYCSSNTSSRDKIPVTPRQGISSWKESLRRIEITTNAILFPGIALLSVGSYSLPQYYFGDFDSVRTIPAQSLIERVVIEGNHLLVREQHIG